MPNAASTPVPPKPAPAPAPPAVVPPPASGRARHTDALARRAEKRSASKSASLGSKSSRTCGSDGNAGAKSFHVPALARPGRRRCSPPSATDARATDARSAVDMRDWIDAPPDPAATVASSLSLNSGGNAVARDGGAPAWCAGSAKRRTRDESSVSASGVSPRPRAPPRPKKVPAIDVRGASGSISTSISAVAASELPPGTKALRGDGCAVSGWSAFADAAVASIRSCQ
mmetsp:Transcript_20486/g.60969  ORF Transcript_20486/g.60969 Transcript_20486/m.60969 type:complete len:229 (-) Transcript_20486:1273-1959(-)